MDRLITAVGQGVPATSARRAGHPDEMWAVSTSMDGKVVLTNRKVSKHAKVWLSWLTKDLRTKGWLGSKSSVSSNTIEICVAGTWMSLLDIPTRKRTKKKSPKGPSSSTLRRKWMDNFATPVVVDGTYKSVYDLTDAEMQRDLDEIEQDDEQAEKPPWGWLWDAGTGLWSSVTGL